MKVKILFILKLIFIFKEKVQLTIENLNSENANLNDGIFIVTNQRIIYSLKNI
jgi:hypothetical protein